MSRPLFGSAPYTRSVQQYGNLKLSKPNVAQGVLILGTQVRVNDVLLQRFETLGIPAYVFNNQSARCTPVKSKPLVDLIFRTPHSLPLYLLLNRRTPSLPHSTKMANQEFPAVSWLGYSLNMAGATPMDITAVSNIIHP